MGGCPSGIIRGGHLQIALGQLIGILRAEHHSAGINNRCIVAGDFGDEAVVGAIEKSLYWLAINDVALIVDIEEASEVDPLGIANVEGNSSVIDPTGIVIGIRTKGPGGE